MGNVDLLQPGTRDVSLRRKPPEIVAGETAVAEVPRSELPTVTDAGNVELPSARLASEAESYKTEYERLGSEIKMLATRLRTAGSKGSLWAKESVRREMAQKQSEQIAVGQRMRQATYRHGKAVEREEDEKAKREKEAARLAEAETAVALAEAAGLGDEAIEEIRGAPVPMTAYTKFKTLHAAEEDARKGMETRARKQQEAASEEASRKKDANEVWKRAGLVIGPWAGKEIPPVFDPSPEMEWQRNLVANIADLVERGQMPLKDALSDIDKMVPSEASKRADERLDMTRDERERDWRQAAIDSAYNVEPERGGATVAEAKKGFGEWAAVWGEQLSDEQRWEALKIIHKALGLPVPRRGQ